MKKFIFIGCILALTLFSLAGCGGGGGSTSTGGSTISGVVLDSLNNRNYLVIGATVTIGSLTTRTNEQGFYSISDVPEGTATVQMTAPQYQAQETTITVVKNQNKTIDVHTIPQDPVSTETFGSRGSAVGQFESPRGICLGTDNLIYIADNSNHRIQIFNPATSSFGTPFGSNGTGDNQFIYPGDIVCDPQGNLYISDQNNQCVKVFNNSYVFQQRIAFDGSIYPSAGWYPGPLAWGLNQSLFVVGRKADGSQRTVTSYLNNPRTMNFDGYISGIAIDQTRGKIYLSYSDSPTVTVPGRIRILNYSDGSLINEISSFSNLTPSGFYPRSLYVTDSGYLWVTDLYNKRIIKLDPSGRYIMHINVEANSITGPNALTFTNNGQLFVTCGLPNNTGSGLMKFSW